MRDRAAIARVAIETAGLGYIVGKTRVVQSMDSARHICKCECLRAIPVPSYAARPPAPRPLPPDGLVAFSVRNGPLTGRSLAPFL